MICDIQSEYFILALHSFNTLKFLFDNVFCEKSYKHFTIVVYNSKVAFTLGQNTPRKMVVLFTEKNIFIYQMAKSTAYYAV